MRVKYYIQMIQPDLCSLYAIKIMCVNYLTFHCFALDVLYRKHFFLAECIMA